MGVYISEINMPKGDGSKLVLQIFPNGEVYDRHGIRLGITNWAEAADVVEVVRCKDCIHRPSRIYGAGNDREGFNLEFPNDWCPMQCEDGWYNRMPRDDFFCSYGERKEKSNG